MQSFSAIHTPDRPSPLRAHQAGIVIIYCIPHLQNEVEAGTKCMLGLSAQKWHVLDTAAVQTAIALCKTL